MIIKRKDRYVRSYTGDSEIPDRGHLHEGWNEEYITEDEYKDYEASKNSCRKANDQNELSLAEEKM